MTEQAFDEALNIYNELEGDKVIKPSKKAWEKFVKFHSLTLDKVKLGEKYKVLGTTFEVVRSLDYNRKEWYPIVKYFDRNNDEYVEFGIVSTDNFAVGVHETCFKNRTGKLLYF
mgnify:CR=1 FL=1